MAYAFLSLIGKGGDDSVLRSLIDRSITEINIPEGIETVGDYAFTFCTRVNKITIPDSVISIKQFSFNSVGADVGIDEVVIPDSVTKLGPNSFRYSGVKKIVLSKNITSIRTNTFGSCQMCALYDFSNHMSVPKLETIGAFELIDANARILVPTSLYSDWIVATNWASFLKHIWVPDSRGLLFTLRGDVEEYQASGIGDCTDSTVVIPSEYEGLPVTRFSAVASSKMTELFIPDSVTWINCGTLDEDFNPNLEKIVFGSGLTRIDRLRLDRNSKCNVYDFSRCEQVPKLGFVTEPVIESIQEGCRVIVPAELLDEWKAATNWSLYADYIVSAN